MEKLNKLTKKLIGFTISYLKKDFRKKLNLKFDDVKRWDLINYLHSNYKFNSYRNRLDDDQLFSKINIPEKIGVDPVSGGNFKGKSDDFLERILKNLT